MTTLSQYTIYDHPRDYPEGFVVRRWDISADGPVAGQAQTAPTLEAARAKIPVGLVCMVPSAGDDPVIVETWI